MKRFALFFALLLVCGGCLNAAAPLENSTLTGTTVITGTLNASAANGTFNGTALRTSLSVSETGNAIMTGDDVAGRAALGIPGQVVPAITEPFDEDDLPSGFVVYAGNGYTSDLGSGEAYATIYNGGTANLILNPTSGANVTITPGEVLTFEYVMGSLTETNRITPFDSAVLGSAAYLASGATGNLLVASANATAGRDALALGGVATLNSTATGNSLVTAADAAAGRDALALGAVATVNSTATGNSLVTAANATAARQAVGATGNTSDEGVSGNWAFGGRVTMNGSVFLDATAGSNVTGTLSDYTIPSDPVVLLGVSGNATITGIAGPVAGRLVWLVNVPTGGNFVLTLEREGTASVAANRILPADVSGNRTLQPNEAALLFYDAVAARWRVLR